MATIDLKALRVREGLNKSAMAELLKVDRAKYETYETGEQELPIETYLEVCGLFGISPAAFLRQDSYVLHDDTLKMFDSDGNRITESALNLNSELSEKEFEFDVTGVERIRKMRKIDLIGKGEELDRMLDKLLEEEE